MLRGHREELRPEDSQAFLEEASEEFREGHAGKPFLGEGGGCGPGTAHMSNTGSQPHQLQDPEAASFPAQLFTERAHSWKSSPSSVGLQSSTPSPGPSPAHQTP